MRARLALVALLLVACPTSSPVQPPAPAALPSPPERKTPATDHCRGYCDAVQRCVPEFAYPGCESDCRRLLAGREESAVSGFTPSLARCWSEAQSCELAAACDMAEGDRK